MNRIGMMLWAVLVVALLALAPVAADAITIPSLPGGAADAGALAKYMPKDATVVVAFNVARLKEAGAIDRIETLLGEEIFEELEAMGIDLKKDVSQAMLGFVVNPGEDEPETYMAMAGDLLSEADFVKRYEEEEGEKPESKTVAGKNVYDIDGAVELCFLPGIMLLVPTEEDIGADITKMLGGETDSLLGNATLVALMKDVNTKASIWAIASLSEEIREAMAEEADEDAPFDVSTFKSVAGSFDYTEKILLNAVLGFTEEEAPTKLAELINTEIKGMADQIAEMMPDLAKLMKAIEAKASGTNATITMNIDRETFDAAFEGVIEMMLGGMVGGGMVEIEEEEEVEW